MDLFVEIDTRCNARCYNCDTGNKTRSPHRRSMDVNLFRRILDHALAIGVSDRQSMIYLFDRGEPTLHPHFSEIVRSLNNRDLAFCISSNFGRLPRLEPELSMRKLQKIVISMPGFSQASYDKVHRLPFAEVIKNIETGLRDWRERGSDGEAIMSMHVYRWNLDELPAASKFCRENRIVFSPFYGSFADVKMTREFLAGTLSTNAHARVERDCFTELLREHIKNKPKTYSCVQQTDRLNISERGEAILCCGAPRAGDPFESGFVLGDFLEMTADQIMKLKRSASVCGNCLASGLAYLAAEPIRPWHHGHFQLEQPELSSQQIQVVTAGA
jgi:MoaA/NifB/PqqE/SkfB family radical SAM enzyme